MARRPATSPEAREDELIVLATDLAERQLREGTASAMVITHYLKMGSPKERLEREKIKQENAHLKAKIESLQSYKELDAKYDAAMKAFRTYRGEDDGEDY